LEHGIAQSFPQLGFDGTFFLGCEGKGGDDQQEQK
jgi:hypothetical protein